MGDVVVFNKQYKGTDHGSFIVKMNSGPVSEDLIAFFRPDFVPHANETPLSE